MAMSNLLDLQEPMLEGGIRSVNFFNGRLLTGKDLAREQDARRASDWRLGLAIGDGVAFGLDVDVDKDLSKPTAPAVKVTAGLAINRSGQVLRLTHDSSVTLTRRFQGIASSDKIFTACQPAAGGTYIAGAGVYLLTIAPAEAGEGKAPTNGLDPLNVRCNTDTTVEAVQFRLFPVKPILYAGLDPSSNTFRNRLAYLCFGSVDRSKWLANLFGPELSSYGLIDTLRETILTDCDVPLALVFLVGPGTIRLIDRWAVRRAPHCNPDTPQVMPLISPRRLSEGQAMFLQFQEQVASLRTQTGDLGAVTATSHFPQLPPAGVIPVNRETGITDSEATKFVSGMTYRGPAFINAARLEMLVRHSVAYPPIDVASGEMIWLYRVRENAMASDFASTGKPQSYVVFASGHIPYLGDAQFDLAYWNYSNYALAR